MDMEIKGCNKSILSSGLTAHAITAHLQELEECKHHRRRVIAKDRTERSEIIMNIWMKF